MAKKLKFFTEFDREGSLDPVLDCQGIIEAGGADAEIVERRTKQSFLDEVNINNIVRRYIQTGEMPVPRGSPLFGIQPNLDLHTAANILAQAKTDFQLLPADIREKVGDFSRFEEFVRDPRNWDELSARGLIEVERSPVPAAPSGSAKPSVDAPSDSSVVPASAKK